MATSAPVKAFALLLFISGVAGATYVLMGALDTNLPTNLASLAAPRDMVNATGGHNVTFIVNVTNKDTAQREITLEAIGVAAGRSEATTIRGGTTSAVFLTVRVPKGIEPGDYALDVRATNGTEIMRARNDLLHLHIMEPAPGFTDGDAAEATYTGRLTATGRVFNMNDRELVGLNIPKTESYRFSEEALQVQTRPRLSIVVGLAEGMTGMQPGESRTVSFGFAKGYGPSTQEQTLPRDEIVPRTITVANKEQTVARVTFNTYINETRQGNPRNMSVDDVFHLEEEGNLWPYKITNISDEIVQYRLAAQPGDAFSIYPFWPRASVVTEINDTQVSLFTTPTTGVQGEKFTMKSHWPGMTQLWSMNETQLVVRHSPPVGFTFTQVFGATPREATVKQLTETTIIANLPAINPLAGKDLTFDVTMISLTKG